MVWAIFFLLSFFFHTNISNAAEWGEELVINPAFGTNISLMQNLLFEFFIFFLGAMRQGKEECI